MADFNMGQFLVQNTNTIGFLGFFIIAALLLVIVAVIVADMMKYNKKVTIYKYIDGHEYEYETKGCIKRDKNKVPFFQTKKFGKDGQRIIMREPSAEYYVPLMKKGILGWTLKEHIAFLNATGDVYIPIRRSFINLKRGVDLKLTSKEECEFCKNGIDSYEFMNNDKFKAETLKNKPDLDFDRVCNRCLGNIINAKFEAVDPADEAWMWKKIEENVQKYGDFWNKNQAMIFAIAMLIFALLAILLALKLIPPINQMASSNQLEAYRVTLQEQINYLKYNNSLPTN